MVTLVVDFLELLVFAELVFLLLLELTFAFDFDCVLLLEELAATCFRLLLCVLLF